MGRLEGKFAVISGAAGGIGREACRRFCEEGASVVGVDISEDGRELERELRGEGAGFEFRGADVSSPEDVAALAVHVRERFGGLDVLFNNAGIILGKPLLQTTEEEWDRLHDANLKSVYLMTKALVPLMRGRSGSVINTSSAGGLVAFENLSAYGAAKAGVAMFSKCAAVDLAPDVRVNAICPGVIDTPMPRSFISALPDREAVWRGFEEGHLLGRVGRPDEVVSLALWLASDEASFMTGAALPIDGGWSTR